jgi:hypothetical protein
MTEPKPTYHLRRYALPDDALTIIHDLRDTSEKTWRTLGLLAAQFCDEVATQNKNKPRRDKVPITAVEKAIANEVGVKATTIHSYRFYADGHDAVLSEFPQLTYSQLRLAVSEARRTGEEVAEVVLRRMEASADGFTLPPPDLWAAELRQPNKPTCEDYMQRALTALVSALKACEDEDAADRIARAIEMLDSV